MTRTVGTTAEVVRAFSEGRALRTATAPVPGGCRVTSEPQPDGTTALYSYRTIVAIRLPDGRIAVTPRRYSVTTSRLMGRVARGTPTGQTVTVATAVPGRWGGFGPAWHPTGTESLPFIVLA